MSLNKDKLPNAAQKQSDDFSDTTDNSLKYNFTFLIISDSLSLAIALLQAQISARTRNNL